MPVDANLSPDLEKQLPRRAHWRAVAQIIVWLFFLGATALSVFHILGILYLLLDPPTSQTAYITGSQLYSFAACLVAEIPVMYLAGVMVCRWSGSQSTKHIIDRCLRAFAIILAALTAMVVFVIWPRH